MTFFLCELWPYLAGGLVGWLLAGWLARRLKHAEPLIDTIVEKKVEVDNSKHLALISKLEKENKEIVSLREKLASFEMQEGKQQGKINELGNIESKVIKKEVDNPEHLDTISSLEGESVTWKRGSKLDLSAAKSVGISIKDESDLTVIEGVDSRISELLHADGIRSLKDLAEADTSHIQKILNKGGSQYQMANPDTWPNQAILACNNRWSALKALQDVLDGGVYPGASKTSSSGNNAGGAVKVKKLESELATYREKEQKSSITVSVADDDKAKAAGFTMRRKGNQDDFTIIEGVGPKINDLIHADGIHTFSALAGTDISVIKKILAKAGPSFTLADPETWSVQSDLAARNEWEKLMTWQNEFDGGKS